MKIATCFAILFAILTLVCGLTAIYVGVLGYSLWISYGFIALALVSLALYWNVVNSVEIV